MGKSDPSDLEESAECSLSLPPWPAAESAALVGGDRVRAFLAAAPEILRLAVPATLGMLSQWLLGLADAYMVGRLAHGATVERGVEAIANVHVGALYFLSLVVTFNALAVGTQAVASRRWGEGDRAAATRTFNAGLALAVGLSVVFLPLYMGTIGWLVHHLTSAEAVNVAVVTDYLHIRFWAIPALLIFFMTAGWFNGVGSTHVPMAAGMVINGVNILLNWCWIEGHWGFARLEERGAALASATSTWIGLGFVALYCLFTKRHAAERLLRRWAFDGALLRRIVRLSIPSFIHLGAAHTGFLIFLGVLVPLTKEGTQAVAASGIVWGTASLSFFVSIGIGVAAATVMGQGLGAGDSRRAVRGVWTATCMALCANLILSTVYITLGGWIVSRFTTDPRVIHLGFWLYVIVGSFLVTDALGIVLAEAFKGAGMTFFVMAVEVPINLGLFLGLAWLCGIYLDWGVIGAWAPFIVYSVTMAGILTTAFRAGLWRRGRA
jgi:MATE family multidrug resistance protein